MVSRKETRMILTSLILENRCAISQTAEKEKKVLAKHVLGCLLDI